MSEWQEEQYVPFETYFEIPLRNGLTKPKRVRGEGYKMINMGEIFKYSRMKNIPMDRVPLNDKELDSSMIADGDLLFARQSLVRDGAGKCSIFLEDDEEVCFESHLIRCRLDKKKSDPLFFYYFFNSSIGKNTMDAIIEQGAGAAGIRGSDLSKLQVPNLSVNRQNIIAEFLDFIDQKIELNQRMNETLEGMARSIFKSWFVDFDPVHAKAEGREPEGMDARVPSLFPSTFTRDGLPEGWETAKVEEVLKRSRVKNRYKKTDVDVCGETPVFEQGSDILLGYHNGIAEFQATPDKPMFIFGDHTCVTKLSCRPFDVSQNVIPLEGSIRDTIWTYYAVSELQKFEEYRRHWAELVAKQLCLPDENTTKAFSEHVLPLLLQKEHNEKQNQTLAALRDTLLPKLISGELRVDTASEKLKEAVA